MVSVNIFSIIKQFQRRKKNVIIVWHCEKPLKDHENHRRIQKNLLKRFLDLQGKIPSRDTVPLRAKTGQKPETAFSGKRLFVLKRILEGENCSC
jgi:hypothetical protein